IQLKDRMPGQFVPEGEAVLIEFCPKFLISLDKSRFGCKLLGGRSQCCRHTNSSAFGRKCKPRTNIGLEQAYCNRVSHLEQRSFGRTRHVLAKSPEHKRAPNATLPVL